MDTTCHKCGLSYKSDKCLQEHLRICLDERHFKCDECEKEFVGSHKLNNHKKSHKVKKCNLCGQTIALNSLKMHMKIHEEDKSFFSCPKCPYISDKSSNLKRHIESCGIKEENKSVHL